MNRSIEPFPRCLRRCVARRRGRSARAALLAIATTAGLASCGAGGIIAATRDGGSNPPTPALSVAELLPLVPGLNAARSVLVANVRIPSDAAVEVRLEALGITAPQRAPAVTVQGASTSVAFVLDTTAILAAIPDATAADVPAMLSVLADQRLVAPAAPVTLARQPRASLAPGQRQRLSPHGDRVLLAVDGLRSTSTDALRVLIATPDPAGAATGAGGPPIGFRFATDVAFASGAGGAGSAVLSATLPGNDFPTVVGLVVLDDVAGQSTIVADAFYGPDIAFALPGQGPTTGGSLVTLVGTALVPYAFGGVGPAPLDYGRVGLKLSKGRRITLLPPGSFVVEQSGTDRLTFAMPASPDGRPGPVELELTVDLGATTATFVPDRPLFLFANPDPFFGPRGAVLDQLPVASVPIRLDNAQPVAAPAPPPNAADAPDMAQLLDQGGVGYVQLLLSGQNGMFQPFGAPRQIGSQAAAERNPRDLVVGDFDRDGIPDLFVVNEGAAGAATATHHVVLGQAKPNPPLGAIWPVSAPAGSYRARVADFDGDGWSDVLLVPGPNAPPGPRPQVLLGRPPLANGAPVFTSVDLNVREFAYEAFEVANLDGQQGVDIAFVSGTELELDVVYGAGDGTFAAGVPSSLSVPGYTPAAASPAVGLHACRDGAQQSLCLVLGGVRDVVATRPTVAVLRAGPSGSYASPLASAVYFSEIPDPIGLSLVADLDGTPPVELVVAMRDDPVFVSLGVLRLQGAAFGTLYGTLVAGSEAPRRIGSLVFDTAFPATSYAGESKAVFLTHEVVVDGMPERRLSTRLVDLSSGLLLLPPDAGEGPPLAIEAVVGGNFSTVSAMVHAAAVEAQTDEETLDLAITSEGAIQIYGNDGFGGRVRIGTKLIDAGLLPGSVARMPAEPGVFDSVVYSRRDSSLGFWAQGPSQPPVATAPTAATAPLRALLTGPLATADLASATLRVADVDGDHVADLVVLLSFAVSSPGAGDARLALLRGKAAPLAGEFPFHEPETLTPVHGNASSFALGDFAVTASPLLELALAIPVGSGGGAVDGDQVQFFRVVAGSSPGVASFVASARAGGPPALIAGSEPLRVVAGDVNRDGRDDLVVACRGDHTLRFVRNTAAPVPAGQPGDVDVQAFVEGLASPFPLADGEPTVLTLRDLNGDGNPDAVAFVERKRAAGAPTSTSVATYLGNGAGELDGPRFASPDRIGNRAGALAGDVGDWNRDGVPDLLLGWDVMGNVHLRVLFGGTR